MTHARFASVELPHSAEGSAQQSAVEVAEWPVGATLFASDVHCGDLGLGSRCAFELASQRWLCSDYAICE